MTTEKPEGNIDSSNGKRLGILRELLKSAEVKNKFVQGPDYWITLPNGVEVNLTTILMEDRINILCFGVDENLKDHHLVGELHTDLENNQDGSIQATGYIETFQRGYQYAIALEVARQDLLQRLSNESNLIIQQQIVDANKNHMGLSLQMRDAWLKIYGKTGYFKFDEQGKKTFNPTENSIVVRDVGSVHIEIEKNEESGFDYKTIEEKNVQENPRANLDEFKLLLKLLLDPTNISNKVEEPF